MFSDRPHADSRLLPAPEQRTAPSGIHLIARLNFVKVIRRFSASRVQYCLSPWIRAIYIYIQVDIQTKVRKINLSVFWKYGFERFLVTRRLKTVKITFKFKSHVFWVFNINSFRNKKTVGINFLKRKLKFSSKSPRIYFNDLKLRIDKAKVL